MTPQYPQLAIVEEVSAEKDRPFHLRARWPAIGRAMHPDWIRPAPADVYRVPRVGGVVQVEPVPGDPGVYQWRGEDVPDQDDLPQAVLDAVGQVMALLPARLRCYLVLDDRSGSAGALRLVTAGGGRIDVRNDGARIDITAPASGGVVRISGAAKVIAEAPVVEIGEGAIEQLMKGTTFKALYDAQTHGTWCGPTGGSIVPMDVPPGTHLSAVGKVK